MMLGHLTIAGFAELFVSAGVVAFLQRSDPSLLRATAGKGVSRTGNSDRRERSRSCGRSGGPRPSCCVLTPLGILAAGSAWGEWTASDYANSAARRQIAATTLHAPLPSSAPQVWSDLLPVDRPFARYAPPYVRSAAFGYLLSAMFGAGLVTLACYLVVRLMRGFVVGRPRQPAV